MSGNQFRRRQQGMRDRVIDLQKKRVLVARIAGSMSADDAYTKVNCEGYGRVREYSEFRLHLGAQGEKRPRVSRNLPTDAGEFSSQVFQLSGCDLHCWYCFVDDVLLRGDERRSRWFSSDELLDLAFEHEADPAVIDLSGGQPELAPEWVLWTMQSIESRGLAGSVAVWSDDNLTCDFWWTCLTERDRSYIREFPGYYRTVCLKGFDGRGFSANTGAPSEMHEQQFVLLQRLVEDRIPLVVYATMIDITRSQEESEDVIEGFVDRLASIDPHLPEMTIPLKVETFRNTFSRANYSRLTSLGTQNDRAAIWWRKIASRKSDRERQFCVSPGITLPAGPSSTPR